MHAKTITTRPGNPSPPLDGAEDDWVVFPRRRKS